MLTPTLLREFCILGEETILSWPLWELGDREFIFIEPWSIIIFCIHIFLIKKKTIQHVTPVPRYLHQDYIPSHLLQPDARADPLIGWLSIGWVNIDSHWLSTVSDSVQEIWLIQFCLTICTMMHEMNQPVIEEAWEACCHGMDPEDQASQRPPVPRLRRGSHSLVEEGRADKQRAPWVTCDALSPQIWSIHSPITLFPKCVEWLPAYYNK